jgi:hypothetical protein
MRTSTSLHAHLAGLGAQRSAARVAAKGVDLRAPLKPTVPAESQHRVSPLTSVMVIDRVVERRLDVGDAAVTLRRIFFFLGHARSSAGSFSPRLPSRTGVRLEPDDVCAARRAVRAAVDESA